MEKFASIHRANTWQNTNSHWAWLTPERRAPSPSPRWEWPSCFTVQWPWAWISAPRGALFHSSVLPPTSDFLDYRNEVGPIEENRFSCGHCHFCQVLLRDSGIPHRPCSILLQPQELCPFYSDSLLSKPNYLSFARRQDLVKSSWRQLTSLMRVTHELRGGSAVLGHSVWWACEHVLHRSSSTLNSALPGPSLWPALWSPGYSDQRKEGAFPIFPRRTPWLESELKTTLPVLKSFGYFY